MTIDLREDERIDNLDCKGYQIIQNKKRFCFGIDAVLLSGFVQVEDQERVLDLGTGTGVIPLLLEAKTLGREFIGMEIQEEVADMACRSVLLNHLEKRVKIITGDIKEASKQLGGASFDVVTCNPPYMKDKHGLKNPDLGKAIARHEILCTLEDVLREAAKVLKVNGRFYMVHRPFRLGEIMRGMDKYGLRPRNIQFVHPNPEREANLLLVEAIRGGNPMVKIQPPFIIFDRDGKYSEQYQKVYGHI